MKYLTILFIVLMTFSYGTFTPWVDKQLRFTYQLNEENLTQESIEKILTAQDVFHDETLKNILLNKTDFINNPKMFSKEISMLEKIIRINKRKGNKYAVLRDEVLVKSYKIIDYQSNMVRKFFYLLDDNNIDEFEVKINDIFQKNYMELQALEKVNYKPYLVLNKKSSILENAQKNINDFYWLIEINNDILTHLAINSRKLYLLNKYTKYNLLPSVLYIDKSPSLKKIDLLLQPLGLNVIKIVLIIFSVLIIYFLAQLLYVWLEKMLLKTKYLKDNAKEIVDNLRKPLAYLLIIINIEIAIYIYYGFNTFSSISNIFNIIYTIFLTITVYLIHNVSARIRIEKIGEKNTKIKYEMINVTIKIVNFIIIILGLLFILYLANVNLTAILSGLGLGGFAIALAAKESLENFFGTISILMSDVFSQGDWITVDGQEGTVVELGLRVTTLRTFDNALITIPNGLLANSDIKNWSRRAIGRRIKMSLGVKYNSKSKDINNAVNEIREMLQKHTGIATENTSYSAQLSRNPKLVSKEDALGVKRVLLVYLDEFSDSSINILVYCFSKTTDWDEWLKTKEDVMYKIMNILEKNSLEFAFPSLSLYNET